MNSLPEEMVAKIFSYLPANDVLNCHLLSKGYHSIFHKYRRHLKYHEISLELDYHEKPVPDGEPGAYFNTSVIFTPKLIVCTAKNKFVLKILRNQVIWLRLDRGDHKKKRRMDYSARLSFEKSLLNGEAPQFAHFLQLLLSKAPIKQIHMSMLWDDRLLKIISETVSDCEYSLSPVEEYRFDMNGNWIRGAEVLLKGRSDSSKVIVTPEVLHYGEPFKEFWDDIVGYIGDDNRAFLQINDNGCCLNSYIYHLKKFWLQKELQNTGIRMICVKKPADTMVVLLYEDVDVIEAIATQLMEAGSFDDYPEEFTMVDREDGSTLTFYFKKVGGKSIVTYNCQYC